MTYWQLIASFACLFIGVLLWGLAGAVLFAETRSGDDGGDAVVFGVLAVLGSMALAGAVELVL